LQTLIAKPFADFFLPEKQQGRIDPSPFASGITGAFWPIIWGLCQIFAQVCKRAKAPVDIQHVGQFPALTEACRLLGTALPRTSQQDVHMLIATMLDQATDQKVKRAALRTFVRRAVDPEPGATDI